MSNQTILTFKEDFKHKSRGRILYKHLSIHEKINLHKNCHYSPHFKNRYSFMMGIENETFEYYLEHYEYPLLN